MKSLIIVVIASLALAGCGIRDQATPKSAWGVKMCEGFGGLWIMDVTIRQDAEGTTTVQAEGTCRNGYRISGFFKSLEDVK